MQNKPNKSKPISWHICYPEKDCTQEIRKYRPPEGIE